MSSLDRIKEKIVSSRITILYLNFIDLKGQVRSKGIYTCELLKNFEGFFHDGISVTGSLMDEYSQKSVFFIIHPIPETFTVVNWAINGEERLAYILCDIQNTSLNSRMIVKHITERLKEHHLKPMSGLGITYRLKGLNEAEKRAGYYKCFPGSELDSFNCWLASILLQSGIELEYFVPSGPEHNHLAFVTKDLLKSMDNYALGLWISTSYALSNKKDIEFSKPFENSAPVHISLWDEQEHANLFYDPYAEYELSAKGYAFMAGVLHHFDELFAIIAASCGNLPTNNYKKKYSYEDDDSVISAPCYFFENRKMARSGWSKRCIFRGIDSNTNLYLVIASIFAAGFYGIKNGLSVEETVDKDYGVFSSSLIEKRNKLRSSELFNELLGESLMNILDRRLLSINQQVVKE